MKALFIQFRRDSDAREREYKSVLTLSGLQPDQLLAVPVDKVRPKEELLQGVDALVVGATGKRGITTDDQELLRTWIEFFKAARSKQVPIIGFNYGAHLLTLAFGGTVTRDESDKVIGTQTVQKTPEAMEDPLLVTLPESFTVQVGHIERMETTPSEAQTLLTSSSGACECWVLPGENIYAFEFQIDLDQESFAQRLIDYQENFAAGPGELEHSILSLKASPDSTKILSLFFKNVVNEPATASI